MQIAGCLCKKCLRTLKVKHLRHIRVSVNTYYYNICNMYIMKKV